MQNLGDFLKEKRQLASLTQRQVAEELGYTTPQFVSNWERGLIAPPIATIKKIIRLYKCNSEETYKLIADEQLRLLKKELI